MCWTSKQKEKKGSFVYLLKRNIVDTIVAIVCVLIFLYLIFGTDEAVRGSLMCNLFSIFVTFIFSWITVKFSCIYQYEKENKKYATTAYRHNRNLITKIDYNIKVLDCIIKKKTQCGKSDGICQSRENLFRLRDSLISFKKDAKENLGDWSNLIAEDISQMSKTRKKYDDYKVITDKSQDDDYEISADKVDDAKKEYEKAYNELDPEFRIIFDEEIKISDEMDTYVAEEEKILMKPNVAYIYDALTTLYTKNNRPSSSEPKEDA